MNALKESAAMILAAFFLVVVISFIFTGETKPGVSRFSDDNFPVAKFQKGDLLLLKLNGQKVMIRLANCYRGNISCSYFVDRERPDGRIVVESFEEHEMEATK